MKNGRYAFLLLCCAAAGTALTTCAPAPAGGSAREMKLKADIRALGGFPDFDQKMTDYATTVPPDAASWTFSVTVPDETGNKLKKYKDTMPLAVGRNTYSVVVPFIDPGTSEETTKRYTVSVYKPRYVSPYVGNMMRVPAGTFQREKRSDKLSAVSEFAMSQHEITINQFWAVMGYDNLGFGRAATSDEPVRRVNWYEAAVFCNRLSLAEGLKPCYSMSSADFPDYSLEGGVDIDRLSIEHAWFEGATDPWWSSVKADYSADGYRLPSYFEWVWAAMGADSSAPGEVNRSGYRKKYAGDTGSDFPGHYAVWREERPLPVGTKLPNELGLYDMTGNVGEWFTDALEIVKVDPEKAIQYPELEGQVDDYRGNEAAPGRAFAPSNFAVKEMWGIMQTPLVPTALYRNDNLGFRVVRR